MSNQSASDQKKRRKQDIKRLQSALYALQHPLEKAGIPVCMIFEGFSASGKGDTIAQVIAELDPRGYKVHTNREPTDEQSRRPALWTFWGQIPAKGKMSILDRSWYNRAISHIEDHPDKRQELLNSINIFERQLCDDGYLLLKFFLDIDKQEQEERLRQLEEHDATAWRVTERDWKRNHDYSERRELMENVIDGTNPPHAPWHRIDNNKRKKGVHRVLEIVHEALQSALETGVPRPEPQPPKHFPLMDTTPLSQVDLSLSLSDEQYKKALDKEQERLEKLHGYLYQKKIPVVLAFEGWDAAGKGGAIRRLSRALDPRGFEVVPVAAPTPDELAHHYLWRFWRDLPKDGHVALFDRSWYGRVMVEKIEGFTPALRCEQAFSEMNEFEQELCHWGAVVRKFWIHIDKEEQLSRFNMRQATPEKQHKITDEDWRNREKWDKYEGAVDEMICRTSTVDAPWIIVEGNNKKYARIKVLRSVREAIEQALDK